jgi:hypothetical protein
MVLKRGTTLYRAIVIKHVRYFLLYPYFDPYKMTWVNNLLCMWDIEPHGNSFLFSLCQALGHWTRIWATVTCPRSEPGWRGVWGQILWLMPSYIISRAWSLLSRLLLLGQCSYSLWVSGYLAVLPCFSLSLAFSVYDFLPNQTLESSYFFALGCLQPPDSWLPTWVHFLFGLWPAQNCSPGFNISILSSKPPVFQIPPKQDPYFIQFPSPWTTVPSNAHQSLSHPSVRDLQSALPSTSLSLSILKLFTYFPKLNHRERHDILLMHSVFIKLVRPD